MRKSIRTLAIATAFATVATTAHAIETTPYKDIPIDYSYNGSMIQNDDSTITVVFTNKAKQKLYASCHDIKETFEKKNPGSLTYNDLDKKLQSAAFDCWHGPE